MPEEKEFMLVGDLSEVQAKPEEKVNGQEHSGTAANGKLASLLSCLARVRLLVEGSGVPDSLESLHCVLDTLSSV